MGRRRNTPFPVRYDLRLLEGQAREEAEEALGIRIIGTAPLYGYEVSISAPVFDNLSNRIPVINSSHDVDVHEYAPPVQREFTRTGAYLYKYDKPNVAIKESLLKGLPHAEDVQTVEGLKLSPYRVFVDMKTGTVQAVVGSYDKTALRFYRRYFSLLPNPIDEMSSKEAIALTAEPRKCLSADGEPVCWLTRPKLKIFLASPRMPYQQDRKRDWKAEEKPLTFVPLRDGVPETMSPHYMLAYNFRYGNFKDGENITASK